jgi:hypothetical protein
MIQSTESEMTLSPAPQAILASATDNPFATRREILAAATALLAAAATGSPAQAAAGAAGYFLVFDKPGGGPYDPNDPEARVFFVPSAWLELFEVTEVYKARYPTTGSNSWLKVLKRVSDNSPGKKYKFSVLYADTMEPDIEVPFSGLSVIPPTPPSANQTYLAAMISPTNL